MIEASERLKELAQKKIRKPSARVWIMWDGVNWTDESSRLKNVSGFEEMGGGLFEEGSGEMDAVFFNADYHFTLGHPNCPITEEQMIPKRRIKVEIGFNGENLTKFNGYIEGYTPDVKSDEFRVHAFDKSYLLKSVYSGYQFYLNTTATELIAHLATLAGLTSNEMILDTTTDPIGFAYFENRTIWFIMCQIAAAEGGRISFDNEGNLVFWNRTHLSFASSPVFTFRHDDYILDQPYEISDKDIKNKIKVTAEPRAVYEEQVIWDVKNEYRDEFQRVYAHQGDDNNNLKFSVELENPVTSFVRPLVAGVDYVANTQPDGSGTDVTDQIHFKNVGSFIKSLTFEVRNNMPTGIAYLTTFQMRGTPAKIYSRVVAEVNSEYSQSLYGVKVKEITNEYITNYDFAVSLAQTQLNMFANTLANFSTQAVAIPWVSPGDIVAVQLVPESMEVMTYLVTAVNWSWTPRSGATMTMRLTINYSDYNKMQEHLAFSSEAHSFVTDNGQYKWGPEINNPLVWSLGAWK